MSAWEESVVVLKPDPRSVRTLLARYASARIALAHASDAAWEQELADVSYTLCVMTGTSAITDAIAAADEILAAAKLPGAQAPREVPQESLPEDPILAA
ncbi:hypothetical protein QFZ75_001375 [Streptomyces sp. V3I8]|jgi:hypothetical protein|uniref:DUF5133 domain-containing protein n=1 Tax=Streptomyces sp. V3I8 TaxID=3042279 RepID=UPI0027810962|nr:DUF5133 domain-containing protein [Streptomyces sp. V3I8]MDQ1034959.1 hypothetical protein [Streptomyces sp. V3I8]